MKEADLKYIIDHVFLPPRLPQKHDDDTHRKDGVLLNVVAQAATRFANLLPPIYEAPGPLKVWKIIEKTLNTMGSIYSEGHVDRSKLQAALEGMEVDDVLPVFVEAQNSAIIFRKITPNALTFEAFEVTLPSEVVVNALGKISMQFPTNPRLPFPADSDVLSTLANVLAHLSANSMKEAIPLAKKGHGEHEEIRNTASPRFITEALAGIIRATPPHQPVTVDTTYIHKRLDDQALWKSALRPWRRSPMWLIIRVTLQSTLEQWDTQGPYGYKAFQTFLMASVINEAVLADPEQFTCDLLAFMNAKTARRLHKLGDIVEDTSLFVLNVASSTVLRSSKVLEARWKEIQRTHEARIQWLPSSVQLPRLEDYTGFSFPNSRPFLLQLVNEHESPKQLVRGFKPKTIESTLRHSLPSQSTLSPSKLPDNVSSGDVPTNLREIEAWVERHLQTWEQSSGRSHNDCLPLATMIGKYRAAASGHYEGDPERISHMHLCILELWVSLDRLCIKWCSLLRDYSPEIAENFADPLVLPYFNQTTRLGHVQSYLKSRRQYALQQGGRSVFLQVNAATSFHNRFFESDQAPPVISFEVEIRSDAARKRAEKSSELQRSNEKHEDLMNRARDLECDRALVYSNGGYTQKHVKNKCSRCKLQKTAKNLKILPYEELLPEEQNLARPIVFELRCPIPFACWRDSTLQIILSFTSTRPKHSPALYPLKGYQPLSDHFRQPYAGYRIGFASSSKSLRLSHYGQKCTIPALESQVFRQHMGNFNVYDVEAEGWVKLGPYDKLRSPCTFQVDGVYETLQEFIEDTRHSPNSVLASISKCPISLSPNEYIAFGMLRAGNRVQWRNIMRAIRSNILSLSEPAVFSLITQAIWQTGPTGEVHDAEVLYREAHIDLLDEGFGNQATAEILRSIECLGGNWKQAGFLALLILLILRIQAYSPHASVREHSARALLEARSLCLDWIKILLEPDISFTEHDSKQNETEIFNQKTRALVNVATVLRASFDIEADSYSRALNSSRDVATYIYTTVLIAGTQSSSLPPIFRTLSRRSSRVAGVIEPHLIEACRRTPSILNDVIELGWPRYSKRRNWTVLSSCRGHWWVSNGVEDVLGPSQVFHLNILDGSLLIDGRALDRLPTQYQNHPTYIELFQDYVFHTVRQSILDEMEYQSYYGIYEIHFGMVGDRLRILRQAGTEIEEYLSKSNIELDLPASLCSNHCFWYSRDSRAIKIRQISETWVTNNEQCWKIRLEEFLQKFTGRVERTTAGGRVSLINPQSPVHSALVNTFAPLEPSPRGLIVTILNDDMDLTFIHIHRHDLTFSLHRGELQCVSFPGYVVDVNLSGIGCLFGLRSVLNLRPSNRQQNGRKLIVPKGEMVPTRGRYGHTDLSIGIGESKGYFAYDVDDLVGRLVGTRTMESDLFLATLHAFTSFCIPDPLTQRTGTMEALDRLSSASMVSYYTVSNDSRLYLDTISALTPFRTFYPVHLKVMETVEWHEHLSTYAQHPAFQSKVADILFKWEEMEVFLKKGDLTKQLHLPVGFEQLTKRVMNRGWNHSYFQSPEGRAEDHEYTTRDSLLTPESREREHLVFQATKFTQGTLSGLPICRNLRDVVLKWDTINGTQKWGWGDVEIWLSVPVTTPIADIWCTFYELCRRMQSPQFDASVALGFQCFRGVQLELVATLGAVINNAQAIPQTLSCPDFDSLELAQGNSFDRTVVLQHLNRRKQSFEESHEYHTPLLLEEGETDFTRSLRARNLYQTALEQEADSIVDGLSSTWPAVLHNSTAGLRLFKPAAETIERIIQPLLRCWAKNQEYLLHIDAVQSQLNTMWVQDPALERFTPRYETQSEKSPKFTAVTLQQLMSKMTPNPIDISMLDSLWTPSERPGEKLKSNSLNSLINRLNALSQNNLERDYIKSLQDSWNAYEALVLESPHILLSDVHDEALEFFQAISLEYTRFYFEQICKCLRPAACVVELMHSTGIWPSITPQILLQSLALNSRAALSPVWISHLICFATSIHDAQRARRMMQMARKGARILLEKEVQYARVWEPSKYPDWLLVEIDSNLSIRPSQATMAEEMLKPDGNRNTIMQLNMGEGKSSVIVPIVAISVSTEHALARVIVPREQMKQQFQILIQTVTSLCNRRVIYLPFNRNLNLDANSVHRIQELLQSCEADGAVWICEPEHLLSLKMLGLDRSMRGTEQHSCSRNLIDLQLWIHSHSKDIIDESDEILHVRQQVIYTVGLQQALDAAPLRWETTQKLLSLLAAYLKDQAPEYDPSSFLVEREPTKGAFPITRIQSEAARRDLHQFIKQSLRNSEWPIPPHMNEVVIEFITSSNPSAALLKRIHSHCSHGDGSILQIILILRGLIGCDILLHSLKEKRWRVQYGLDLQRSQLAIPYRAKDSPSPRSEFGHPDVIILLTCLSYYYSGLDLTMITQTLQSLASSEAPELTYAEWLKGCWEDVPLALRRMSGINLQDQKQLRSQLFPLLRYNKGTIDFYLNAFVFPACAKEFPSKLSTSGWDIAVTKPNPTTGFSGTNDGRYLLPVTIKQTDRDAQLYTNAKVLSFILKENTASVVCYPNFLGSIGLLERIQALPSKPTVILDVGAQILDLSNLSFVQHWLAMYRDHPIIKAAVFFDESSNLLVITPDGSTQLFIDSPYSSRLDQCLVYLDEAHTRGTDLRIPDTQAVVTLGPRLNKDKLVQGCMRMRKLGVGHTVVFMASEEVVSLVRQATKSPSAKITTEDIITWSIRETWQQLQANLPAWMLQGHSFVRRDAAWKKLSETGTISHERVASLFCEPEAQTLEQLYGTETAPHGLDPHRFSKEHSVASHDTITQAIVQRCIDFDLVTSKGNRMDEEMEIELVHEKEVEREVERPLDAEPSLHVLNSKVKQFVSTGDTRLCLSKDGFKSAAAAFENTSLIVPPCFKEIFTDLVVTEDFCRTIQVASMASYGWFGSSSRYEPETRTAKHMDNFMRPVEWVVTATTDSNSLLMVLFSPYEVDQLLPEFRTSNKVNLHMFAPRTNLAVSSFEDLDFLTLPSKATETPIPRPLAMQLNLFSGSLYFRDYQTYLDVCRVLRLHFGPLPSHLEKPEIINANFFVLDPKARVELGMGEYGFSVNALPFFQNMIKMRRFGRGFGPSHMGKILYGTRLKESDFLEDTQVAEVGEDTVMLDG